MHTERTVREFAADLAAGTPVPGGGGAAALAGALAAALAAMVINYTVGRPRFADVEAEMRALLVRSDTVRDELLTLVERDAEAYRAVIDAQALPRDSAAERTVRDQTLQGALAAAVRVPLRVAVLAADALALCEPIAERGNRRLISDAAVAALLADAALRSAALNVRINLGDLNDHALRDGSRAALATLLASASEIKPRIMTLVDRAIA